MKAICSSLLMIFVAGLLFCGCQDTARQVGSEAGEEAASFVPETQKERISYVIGVNMALSLQPIRDEVDLKMVQQGLEDSFRERPLRIENEEAQALMAAFGEKVQIRQQQQREMNAETNLEAGALFLEENRQKEGVVTTESGLQYFILQAGTGARPTANDTVSVHYRGTTIDGKEFDSSYQWGEPAKFQVSRVIPGWVEGLQLMPVGSRFRLFIPSDLAYGQQGAGKQVGPNETLIFDVELLDIVNP